MVQRVFSLLLVVFFEAALVLTVSAQEGGENREIPIESEWIVFAPDAYARGDVMFTMAAGTLFPVLFLDGSTNPAEPYDSKIKIGGNGILGFNYFLSPNLFLGGEISLALSGSVNNILFQFPFGFRAGYQFVSGRFEFPLNIMIGAYSQTYLTKSHFGLFLKSEAGFYWRFNSDWSFGINAAWWWMPQWPETSSEDTRYGNFLNLTLSARYIL